MAGSLQGGGEMHSPKLWFPVDTQTVLGPYIGTVISKAIKNDKALKSSVTKEIK